MRTSKLCKSGIMLLLAVVLCCVKVVAQDQIAFTWHANGEKIIYRTQATNAEEFYVNWGDGSAIDTETGLGYDGGAYTNVQLTHNYAEEGEYTVTITAGENCRFYYFDCSGFYNSETSTIVNNQISSLLLTDCTELQQLFCYYNQLTTLDVSSCSALWLVYCAENLLTSVTCSPAVQRFYCHVNQLLDLDLSTYTELTMLMCSHNQLTELNLNSCPNLQELSCDYNQLSTIDISSCPNLQEFWCNFNLLQALDVSNSQNLQTFICNNNQIHTLNTSGCTSLHILSCGNNVLTELDLTDYTSLTEVSCTGNELSALNINGCSSSLRVYCNENKLRLSDLFEISELIDDANNKWLGTQYISTTADTGDELFADQSVFSDIFTNYSVNPDGYHTVVEGKLIFNAAGDYTVVMTNDAIIANPDFSTQVIAEITVNSGVNINGNSLLDIPLYPNPTSDSFIIDFTGVATVKLYDMLGKEVLSQNTSGKIEMNISLLPDGMYSVQVLSEDKIIGIGKLIKD